MAEGKKSFIIYSDSQSLVNKLPNEVAGELFKMLFSYVNDENPTTENPLTDIAFEHFRQKLKKDLVKWNETRKVRSKAGKASAESRKQKATNSTRVKSVEKKATNSTVSVNDNVNVSDSVSTNVDEKKGVDENLPYQKMEFLKDWNELRTKHLKKPSHANSLGGYESGNNFETIKKDYNREEIKKALIGLFKQKKLPNGNTVMQSNPKHFLSHFESYHSAFYDKNENLYGKEKDIV